MKKYTSRINNELTQQIKSGDIGVLLTDTLYGVVASADNGVSVERVYDVRGRDRLKPCIVLISSIEQMWDAPSQKHRAIMEKYWPGPFSIVVPVGENTPEFVHRGGMTVAFRIPADKELQSLLEVTGPLIAPSANPEGYPPATNIAEAEQYFEDLVDFYVDSGTSGSANPSRVVELTEDGEEKVLR